MSVPSAEPGSRSAPACHSYRSQHDGSSETGGGGSAGTEATEPIGRTAQADGSRQLGETG